VIQQAGKPQDVYDDPSNLFVAKFLGTPPINVFSGKAMGGKLYLGDVPVLDIGDTDDQDVWVGIRPEGFIMDDAGPLVCDLSSVEVMGRDVSIVSKHPASDNPVIRSIINADAKLDMTGTVVRYSLKPHKVFIFDSETEERIYFGDQTAPETGI
jgi:multiple sugar transport system ATP-binding protein